MRDLRVISRFEQLLHGLDDDHLVRYRERGLLIHEEVVQPLDALTEAAAEAGIELRVVSGHRSFAQQRSIWNAKATGRRKLVDANGAVVKVSGLTPDQIIEHILRWSALPGASRHHWGTDIDVYDAAAVPRGYKVQLTAEEAVAHFGKLHGWLDHHMMAFGFFRPYARDLGGIAPEAWHISYAPLAGPYFAAFSIAGLERALADADVALKDEVLERLPELHERYFSRIAHPPEQP